MNTEMRLFAPRQTESKIALFTVPQPIKAESTGKTALPEIMLHIDMKPKKPMARWSIPDVPKPEHKEEKDETSPEEDINTLTDVLNELKTYAEAHPEPLMPTVTPHTDTQIIEQPFTKKETQTATSEEKPPIRVKGLYILSKVISLLKDNPAAVDLTRSILEDQKTKIEEYAKDPLAFKKRPVVAPLKLLIALLFF